MSILIIFLAYQPELVSQVFPEAARVSYIYHNMFRPLTGSTELSKSEKFNNYFMVGMLMIEQDVEAKWIAINHENKIDSLLLRKKFNDGR